MADELEKPDASKFTHLLSCLGNPSFEEWPTPLQDIVTTGIIGIDKSSLKALAQLCVCNGMTCDKWDIIQVGFTELAKYFVQQKCMDFSSIKSVMATLHEEFISLFWGLEAEQKMRRSKIISFNFREAKKTDLNGNGNLIDGAEDLTGILYQSSDEAEE